MDWSGLATLLPIGATGFAIALMYVAIRMALTGRRIANEADARYRAEVKDHAQTQSELDAERDRRRVVEDKMDEFARQVRDLNSKVATLEKRLAGLADSL